MSGVGNITEQGVESLPSYVKDSIHFLKIIEYLRIPPDALLVFLDIENGLAVVKSFLDQLESDEVEFNSFFLDLLSHILHHTLDGSHYHQVHGVAMGTCCAPTYTNLYLGGWEWNLISYEELLDLTKNILT